MCKSPTRARRDGRRRVGARSACPGWKAEALTVPLGLLVARVARQLGQVGGHFQTRGLGAASGSRPCRRRGSSRRSSSRRAPAAAARPSTTAGRTQWENGSRDADLHGKGPGRRAACADRGHDAATAGSAQSSPASRSAGFDDRLARGAERRDRQAHARPQRPSRAIAHLVGAGLGSTNSAWCSGSRCRCSRGGLARVAGQRRDAQLLHRARRDVGGDADVAVAAEQHQRDGGAVVARVDREALRRAAGSACRRARCRRWLP